MASIVSDGDGSGLAAISVEACWQFECRACGGLLDVQPTQALALAEAREHAIAHRAAGDRARVFTGRQAWYDAEAWAKAAALAQPS